MLYSRASAGSRFGQWFMVAPPLTITEEEVAEVLRRIESSLQGLCQEAHDAGLLS